MAKTLNPEHRELKRDVMALQLALTRNALAQVDASDANDTERLAQLATEEDQLAEALHIYEKLIKRVPKFTPST